MIHNICNPVGIKAQDNLHTLDLQTICTLATQMWSRYEAVDSTCSHTTRKGVPNLK